MCNSLKSTLVTWLVMLSLFLSGCAAVQPGAAVMPHVTELNPEQAANMVRAAGDATSDILRLYNPGLKSWTFVQYVDGGYNVVAVVPCNGREVVSRLHWTDVNNLFQTLKNQGWKPVSLGTPWVAAAIQGLSKMNFIFIFLGQFDDIPGYQEAGLG